MKRIFWKLFLIFLLAQTTTVVGVSVAFWVKDHLIEPEFNPDVRASTPDDRPPPPQLQPGGPSQQPMRPPFRPRGGPGIPFMPFMVGLVGSLIFAAVLARYLAKPVTLLRSGFDSVAKGRLDVHLGTDLEKGFKELAPLGHDFDRMAKQIKDLMEGQKRLLHDVSHEMRSPLARLSVAVDLVRQQPEKLETWLQRMEREAGRMDHLVGELLAIARIDSGEHKTIEVFGLRQFLEPLVSDARFEAAAMGRMVTLEMQGECMVQGQQELLVSAVENVVRNAMRYTKEGSSVKVVVLPDNAARHVCISIRDQGPGLPEQELHDIFAPFYRSRNSPESQGYGLGLAIAKRVIAVHQGKIAARNLHEGGLAVDIELPMAGAV